MPGSRPRPAALLPPRLKVPAGRDAVARVVVRPGELPRVGIPLVLRGSAAIPGGPARGPQASTDASGVAVFRFPVGRSLAMYRLTVVTGSGASMPGTPSLDVVVGPAAQIGRAHV